MKIDVDILITTIKAFIAEAVAEGMQHAHDLTADDYISADQACALLGISRPTLREWTKQGKILGFKPNSQRSGRWLYPRKSLTDFMKQQQKQSMEYQEIRREERKYRRGIYLSREKAMKESGRYISIDDYAEILKKAAAKEREIRRENAAKKQYRQHSTYNPPTT